MLFIAITIGIATAINMIVLMLKLRNGNYGDFAIEVGALVVLALLFGQTVLGMLVAMIASLSFSAYLAFSVGGRMR